MLFLLLFSSPEPLGSQGGLIVYPCSVVRRRDRRCRRRRCSHFSIIFFSETAWPIKLKFHVQHPKEEGTIVCINGQGHMTMMAAMAINSKNL